MLRRLALLVVPALALLVGSNASAQSNPKGGRPNRPNNGKTDPGKTDPGKGDKPQANKGENKVTVVFFGNAKCPVSGKEIDHDKFFEVDGERIYVCSDACIDAVKKDPKGMLAKAYPGATNVATKGCAVCGKAVEAGKGKDATFEGRKVMLCGDGCVAEFKKDPAMVLVKATWPDAKDAKNSSDPIDGKPVAAGVMAICHNHVVHFASAKSLAAFRKDPLPTLQKLKLD